MLLPCRWCTALNSATESADLKTCLTIWAQRCAKTSIACTNRVILGHSIGCETSIITHCGSSIAEFPSLQPTIHARMRSRYTRRRCVKYLKSSWHRDALERTVAKLGPTCCKTCLCGVPLSATQINTLRTKRLWHLYDKHDLLCQENINKQTKQTT